MKFSKIICAAVFTSILAMTTSCREDFQELNQNPANVTVTDPAGLMTNAILKFQPTDYLIWFYNINYFTRWSQMSTPSGSFSDSFTEQAECGGQGSQYIETLRIRNEIKNYIEVTGDQTQLGYEAACTVLTVYLALFDSDIYGALPYTEACQYKTQQILTPKYETVEELYSIFLSELDAAIAIFQKDDIVKNQTQDLVYGGDWSKWAKLANSLKLKVAVRMYHQKPEQAIKVAEAVASSSVGYLDNLNEDMRFNKASQGKYNADENNVYGTVNGLASPALSANVAKFMLGSLDPRIRFTYGKNSFNSTIVQGFIDAGRYEDLPTAVKEVVVLDEDGNFKEWGGLGEPWVRYVGLPVVFNGDIKEEYAEYFNPGDRYRLTVDEASKSYSPFSYQTSEMKKGRTDYSVPTLGTKVIQDTDDNPLYQMYLTAAEVNLYLAEFKLLGANLPKSAADYYNRGVQFSVETYDALAAANKIPYYGTTYGYDPHEASIELKAGELEAMMATENVKLEGTKAEQIEKVYLQQLIHFTLQPDDQFVTARRSGYPMMGSNLLPFIKFNEVALEAIPRRFEISTPKVTDKMYDILVDIYKKQGFNTLGSGNSGAPFNSTSSALNTERLWQDKGAPQWGTGYDGTATAPAE